VVKGRLQHARETPILAAPQRIVKAFRVRSVRNCLTWHVAEAKLDTLDRMFATHTSNAGILS